MRNIFSILFSTRTTIVLLVLFGAACAWGTFLENDYGTPAAKAFIYGAWWFELIMALLAVNFIANIKRYKLLSKQKFPLLLFHLGFVIILVGAFVSRYTGFEGMIDIREGSSKDYMLSEESYINIKVGDDSSSQRIKPTALTHPNFSIDVGEESDGLTVKAKAFFPGAEEAIIEGKSHILVLVVAEANQRKTYYLEKGKSILTPHGKINFSKEGDAEVSIYEENDLLLIKSGQPMEFMEMTTQMAGSIQADSISPLKASALYKSGTLSFVVESSHPNAALTFRTAEDKKRRNSLADKLVLTVEGRNKSSEVVMDYKRGSFDFKTVHLGEQSVELSIGPRQIPLGFSIFLKDFELIRYPGSTSPSSYSSFVEVRDVEKSFPFHIYMNNVLDYKGFRFFQASYDEDELGTVLSVNHDWWGTWVTYLGYFMLGFGMLWSLFYKSSRFHLLNNNLKKIKEQKLTLSLVLAISFSAVFAEEEKSVERMASIYPAEVLEPFGSLLIQDMDGRIKPVNTLASELTRKLTGKTKFNLHYDNQKVTLSANQLFLAIHARPDFWLLAPVIKIDVEKGAQILDFIGKPEVPFIAVRDFFDDEGNYLLTEMVDEAYKTKQDQRSKHLEEVIKVDERFNILYQALTDSYIKIFPKPGDLNHKWYSDKSSLLGFEKQDSMFVKNIFKLFYMAADSSFVSGDWEKPKEYLSFIGIFQSKFASEILPEENRVKAELLYNKLKLFLHLFYSYWVLGIALLVIAILKLFNSGKAILSLQKVLLGITSILFIVHTFNIILRWYAGGYPPWSNGYEMIVLVSWATMLFGLLFTKRTDFILPLACLFTGTLLFVAFLDWLNPEITNLVPVLKSYWLKIHVAIIVGSYAPLALSALLGFTALWMMIVSKSKNDRVLLSIKEITTLSEVSMTIGIYMLAIGTFLGGIWANESWGRYWGWDPKETWALISILVYAIILHLRLIPTIEAKQYWFNATSVVGFFSIIMTSFGVNYYLSGLHSYAQGDPVPIPVWVYYMVAVVLITVIWAFFKRTTEVETPE